ncbi:helix-turn-helix domain-containing protein [Longimicrobium terrae]|uniref:AraC-like DNA-binding protein n=1 Tax=Longimicrobium terrae TaxID=1639882 RepID=A0A841GX62_9BACT|nr:helix-turn-helix domain-containing protein [Longimicrobium terrae]MBB4635919.1 AraC-like DNA-binding protein [Longimicrobium terrae]MBB6070315.1 AraC-like DNA-binding protein [Longimicrobium terrae]
MFILHEDRAFLGMLRRIESGYELRQVSSWEDLTNALRRAPLTAVSVVDPWHRSGGTADPPPIHRLTTEFPAFSVVAVGRFPATAASDLHRLLGFGIADALDLDRENTPGAVARRLRVVRGRSARILLARAVDYPLPSRTRALLQAAVEVVGDGGQAPQLAAALRADERTVLRWLDRAGLPAPRRLLAWLRLLFASELLDDPARTIEGVARLSGYAGAVTLKAAYRNFLGQSVPQLRACGAFTSTAMAMKAEFRRIRENARGAGQSERVWLN